MSQKAGWLSPPPETLPPDVPPEPLLGTGGPTCTPGRPFAGATSIVNSRCDFAGRHQEAEGGSWSESSSQNDQLPARRQHRRQERERVADDRRLDRSLRPFERGGVAAGEQVADASDRQEQGRERRQQAGEPDAEVREHAVDVARGERGRRQRERECRGQRKRECELFLHLLLPGASSRPGSRRGAAIAYPACCGFVLVRSVWIAPITRALEKGPFARDLGSSE